MGPCLVPAANARATDGDGTIPPYVPPYHHTTKSPDLTGSLLPIPFCRNYQLFKVDFIHDQVTGRIEVMNRANNRRNMRRNNRSRASARNRGRNHSGTQRELQLHGGRVAQEPRPQQLQQYDYRNNQGTIIQDYYGLALASGASHQMRQEPQPSGRRFNQSRGPQRRQHQHQQQWQQHNFEGNQGAIILNYYDDATPFGNFNQNPIPQHRLLNNQRNVGTIVINVFGDQQQLQMSNQHNMGTIIFNIYGDSQRLQMDNRGNTGTIAYNLYNGTREQLQMNNEGSTGDITFRDYANLEPQPPAISQMQQHQAGQHHIHFHFHFNPVPIQNPRFEALNPRSPSVGFAETVASDEHGSGQR